MANHPSHSKTGPLPCHTEGLPFTHSFLVIPSCPVPLLGRDVFFHLGASLQLVRLDPKVPSSQLLLPLLGLSLQPSPSYPPLPITQNPINPQVWDASKPIIATHHSPVLIRLKDPSKFPSRPQFPISETHLRGLQPIITRLLNQGLLIPTDSPCNTPILPVRKASGDYRLVQDLRLINEAIIPLHPVVWIPNFAPLGKPLYLVAKETPQGPLTSPSTVRQAFLTLRKALISSPPLSLPNPNRPFHLFVDERAGIATGLLAQLVGPSYRPVAYLSKQLDPTIRGWQPCLRALAAAAGLTKQTLKLTLAHPLTVFSSHRLVDLLGHKSLSLLGPSRIQEFHLLFIENPAISLDLSPRLNPASLLPSSDTETSPSHSCPQVVEALSLPREGLFDTPLSNPDRTLFVACLLPVFLGSFAGAWRKSLGWPQTKCSSVLTPCFLQNPPLVSPKPRTSGRPTPLSTPPFSMK
ncbi:uncharacterized protein LOC116762933 [Phocoena sinus]|uniref:uncharacterized protein LOC116762933 n=1 Tax=Phocoena sinus TaxID=42100 RepID=UPI0013C43A6E|nr:uncharacterized protein LOC116762933 [Phocoena sinus]